jgi:glycosyltransferase involved in cell wall biosynthesis
MASDFTMICIANAFAYKGHDDLFAALQLIKYDLPPWRLLLVGRGTEKYSYQDDYWDVCGMGEQECVPFLLRRSHLFILPSHEEGSSNALLEAMASLVPVIATDVGGNNDTVINGITGYLVPPKSPPDLAKAILWMATNPERRFEFAANAKVDVAKRFSLKRCVDEYADLYRSAVKGA